MKFQHILLVVLLSAVTAFAVIRYAEPHATIAAKESAYEHVMRTGTVRCAYASYDPMLIVKDSAHISGIFHDAVEEAAKRLNLKVEWVEEVGYGNINTGFMTGRYDAFCAGLWPAGTRASNTIFSRAIVWDPVSVWVRGNDARFDGHMEKLDDPAAKLASIDGDATVSMIDAMFPKSARISVSQNQTIGEEIEQVTAGKADALFQDYLSAERYMRTAPGSLKDLSPGKPPLIYALTVGFNQHETELKGMFDVVLDDMRRDGAIAKIVKNYLGDKSNLLYDRQEDYKPY